MLVQDFVAVVFRVKVFRSQGKSVVISETISHYRIISKLGAGGMGEVYLAEDKKLSRKVAIKLLPRDSTANEAANRRLLREARAAATLDHPNIRLFRLTVAPWS